MNPYENVTDVIVANVGHAINSAIDPRPWDGGQRPLMFLEEISGPDLAEEYLRVVNEYTGARKIDRSASAEELFRVSSHPLIQRFLHSWGLNMLSDELAILSATVASLGAPAASVCDLGCGPGWVTLAMAQLLGCRVLGVDRVMFWNHAGLHSKSERFSNAGFLQLDIFNECAPEQFDIVYARGLKPYGDPGKFWPSVFAWSRPGGLVFVTGDVDASSSDTLAFSIDGLKGLWPIACVPIGGPYSMFRPNDPGTLLICERRTVGGDLVATCHQLSGEYRRLVADARSFLNDESIPYHQRTFSRLILTTRSSIGRDSPKL